MKLEKHFKEILVKELHDVAKKIKKETDLRRKVYFYSAVRGIAERIMRLHFDSELLLTTIVVGASYNHVSERVNMFVAGDRIIPVSPETLNKLADYIDAVADNIEKGKVTYKMLEKIATLSYTTTGPGYYTLETGKMKI